MSRVPRTRSRAKASDNIDFESDNEDLRDEIDKFHDEKQKIKPGAYRRAQKAQAEEVLNVEGDRSDEEELDSGDESSDFDDNDAGISSNQWGRKRQDHYSTDFVDQDWGGMRDEEMEAAELEEEDALARQKELDRAAAQLVDDFDDEDEEAPREQKKQQISKSTELKWSFPTVKKLNREMTKLAEQYKQKSDLMTVLVQPLESVVGALPEKAVLRRQLQMVIDVYSKYLLNALCLLRAKTDSFERQQITDEILDAHPVNEEYLRSKLMIEKADAFLIKNSDYLEKLLEKVKRGESLTSSSLREITKKKPSTVSTVSQEISEMDLAENDDEEEDGGDGKRKAFGSIAKNSKSVKTKKKKEKHAKVANRRKYKEIQKKVRSQVGKIRQETEKYTGEARGIRASTIKSVKLIA